MSEILHQPTLVEESVFTTGNTPYDEFATFEVTANDLGEDPSRLTQLFQEYGRKAGALLLAGTALVGLDACAGPGGQTTGFGDPRPVKVLSIGGGKIETGNCILQKQAGQKEPGHNCSPQTSQLKNQSVSDVRSASNQGLFGGTDSLTIQPTERSCSGPGAKFVASISVGSVIEVAHKSYVDLKQTPNKTTQYCVWSVK